MLGALRPKAHVDRLYIPRKVGGRGFLSIESSVQQEVRSVSQYVHESEEKLLQCILNEGVMKQWDGKTSEAMKQEKRERQYKWQQWPLQFLRHTEGKRIKKNCMWLQRGDMKKETEATLIAAHDQAITTNAVKVKIRKQQGSPLCRMCKEKEESIVYVLSECTKLAKTHHTSSTTE